MRHGIRTHCTAEHQQNGGKDRGLDHRERDAEHRFPLRRVQNGRRLLKIRVHVAEDAADQDIGKRRIVQTQHHEAREQALAPPDRHVDAEQGCQQAVGRAGDGVGVKQVLPHDSQRPLRHDIRENKDGAEILSPRKVGARDQKREQAAVEDGHKAGSDRQQHRIEQRRP